jgi:alpha-tubulin suppressor-like RCC1 family protein
MKRKNVDETQNRQLKIAPSKNDILSICNTNETKLLCKFDAVIVYVSHYAHFTLLVTKDGRLFGVGDSRIKNIPKASLPTLIETPGHVASASFGNKRIIAIMQDGTLMGMGDNTSNALGFTSDYVETMTALPSKNHNYERVEFVTCVYSSSIAITSQSLFVFGQM